MSKDYELSQLDQKNDYQLKSKDVLNFVQIIEIVKRDLKKVHFTLTSESHPKPWHIYYLVVED